MRDTRSPGSCLTDCTHCSLARAGGARPRRTGRPDGDGTVRRAHDSPHHRARSACSYVQQLFHATSSLISESISEPWRQLPQHVTLVSSYVTCQRFPKLQESIHNSQTSSISDIHARGPANLIIASIHTHSLAEQFPN